MNQFFNEELSKAYDERNRALAPISENMHFLFRLALKDLPANARILCVGVGTGAEILPLATANPGYTFFGVDPSAPMLEVGAERLRKAGVLDRCELRTGYVQDAPAGENFDAVLSVLVGHFVPRAERAGFYGQMSARLKKGGYLVNAEISYDLDSPEFPPMLENWKQVQTLMGATPERLTGLAQQMRENLTVLPPAEIEGHLRQGGIAHPLRIFQAFMIHGWCGRK